MQVRPSAHRADLAGAEHPDQRTVAEVLVQDRRVVVGRTEQVDATGGADEGEGGVAGRGGEEVAQVLIRRRAVLHVELDRGAHLDLGVERDRPACPVGAQDVTHEEVGPVELTSINNAITKLQAFVLKHRRKVAA